MDMKSWYASKTIWFNLLTFIIALAGVFGFSGFQPTTDMAELIATVIALINIVLRFYTTRPIR